MFPMLNLRVNHFSFLCALCVSVVILSFESVYLPIVLNEPSRISGSGVKIASL